jgi:hypothetical protein
VRTEFQRNASTVLDDTAGRLDKRCEEYRHALAIIAAYSDVPAIPSVDKSWVEKNVKHGHRLALEFLAAAATEPASDDDQVRASTRVWTRVAPAEAGNNNLADCVITEIALRVARSQSQIPNAAKVVLFSSNTADFCDVRHLKPALQAEFDAVELQYVKNWGEAWAATVR